LYHIGLRVEAESITSMRVDVPESESLTVERREVTMIAFGMGGNRGQHIAVVEMEGVIGPRMKAGEYQKLFRSLEENERVKAVVLDVDSPGGSASASDLLYLSIQALAKKKPVVSFIRGTGASGSYLFSCAANRIIAIPSAIIGSIGVISMRPLLYEAMDSLKVKVSVTKSDRFKDMGSMFRPPTDEEVKKEQELVDDLYEQFLDVVIKGRNMTREQARAVATGEIFTGRKAVELGLIDEVGDLERAIDIAVEMSQAPRKPVWVRPKRGLRDMLAALSPAAIAAEAVAQVEERLQARVFYQQM
jgi:protease-4